MVRTIEWRNGAVVMIDQRLLPTQEVYRVYRDYREVARAIKDMVIRGAPAIGVAAALGIALGMRQARGNPARAFERICKTIAATRPTAVNLFWAIERMRGAFARVADRSLPEVRDALLQEARAIHREDITANRALGKHGAALIPARAQVLTHCNAGALATAGYGTALGVIRAAQEGGKQISVLATETRPFLQGARLTAWELKKEHIPATLITDSMAGCFMRAGDVSCVVVGADRIAANGDVANKIGTYSLAVLAKRHGIPFFVAAPTSTVDLACPSGAKIPIENRDPREITHIGDRQIAPTGVQVSNPAFDITPQALVSAIITERGVARAPYRTSLRRMVLGGRQAARGRRAKRTARQR
ncbi:MAG TPA: S-methyl-5-thioribose-1-phosphate isomerase [Candidatus Margulisiibacteriota bacterium]|nr:S-methyl-5-thioribose-1-phosphate isomerase [Candidatus Margulisiibacteriota bacterium]